MSSAVFTASRSAGSAELRMLQVDGSDPSRPCAWEDSPHPWMGFVGWGGHSAGLWVCADNTATAAWASASQWVPGVLTAGCGTVWWRSREHIRLRPYTQICTYACTHSSSIQSSPYGQCVTALGISGPTGRAALKVSCSGRQAALAVQFACTC